MIKFINLLKEEVDKNKIISDLKSKIKKEKDRLEYEEFLYEKLSKQVKTDVPKEFYKFQELELKSIEAISNRLNPEERDELKAWIKDFRQYFESFNEK